MSNRFCLHVTGDYACFTRPENKVERLSYDLITPSAARAVFEAILWKPGIRWRMRRIEVLKPVRWISVRRNEVGAIASSRTALQAMERGRGAIGIDIEDERQQRAGLFLRDVGYRLHADLELCSDEARANPSKYLAMFERRAANGQCVNQPYLGCREFACDFRLARLDADGAASTGEPEALRSYSAELGWMLFDFDFRNPADPKPQFFRAKVDRGVMNLSNVELNP